MTPIRARRSVPIARPQDAPTCQLKKWAKKSPRFDGRILKTSVSLGTPIDDITVSDLRMTSDHIGQRLFTPTAFHFKAQGRLAHPG